MRAAAAGAQDGDQDHDEDHAKRSRQQTFAANAIAVRGAT
jgi:hypothetical protein